MPRDEGGRSIELSRAERGPTRPLSLNPRIDRWTRYGVWLAIAANTLDALQCQARPTPAAPAEPAPPKRTEESAPTRQLSFSERVDGWTRYGIFFVIMAKLPGERRFQTGVITSVIGALAVSSLLKNNQARPVRRAVAWYNVHGQIQDIKVHHEAIEVVNPAKMLEAGTSTRPGQEQ